MGTESSACATATSSRAARLCCRSAGSTISAGEHAMKPLDTLDSVLRFKGRQVWSIAPTATVYEAIARMSEKSVGALLVLSEGRLEGIISERDYARKVILKERSSKDTPVWEIMTDRLITASPNSTVEECMRVMTENRIRHLPVVDGEKVVGIVSIGDLVNWTITARGNHRAFAGLYRRTLSRLVLRRIADVKLSSRCQETCVESPETAVTQTRWSHLVGSP